MDDSQRPSEWQDDAVQAADTHRGLAARGRETEKKRRRPEQRKGARGQAPRHECAEKHEDTIKRGLKRDCKGVRVERTVLGVVPASSWVGRP